MATLAEKLGPGMASLLKYLTDKNVVSDVSVLNTLYDSPSSGSFNTNTKQLEVLGPKNAESTKRTGMHEAVHALSYSDLPSRQEKISGEIAEMNESMFGPSVNSLAFPQHWAEGYMEETKAGKNLSSLRQSDYSRMIDKTRELQKNAVLSSIPDKTSWSGMTNKDIYPDMEEVKAYFLTSPEVKGDKLKRIKQFGMYLRDKNIPWEVVDMLMMELRDNSKPGEKK